MCSFPLIRFLVYSVLMFTAATTSTLESRTYAIILARCLPTSLDEYDLKVIATLLFSAPRELIE